MAKKHPLIANKKIVVSAGVWDVLSAKLAERAGFSTVVLSGYAVSASHLGEPHQDLVVASVGDHGGAPRFGHGIRGLQLRRHSTL